MWRAAAQGQKPLHLPLAFTFELTLDPASFHPQGLFSGLEIFFEGISPFAEPVSSEWSSFPPFPPPVLHSSTTTAVLITRRALSHQAVVVK